MRIYVGGELKSDQKKKHKCSFHSQTHKDLYDSFISRRRMKTLLECVYICACLPMWIHIQVECMLLWECVWELCSTGNIGIRKDAALSGLWETWIALQFYLHILSLFVTLKNIMSDTQAAKPAGTNCDSASTENNFLTNISQGKVARYGWMDGLFYPN